MLKERIFWHDTITMAADSSQTPLPAKVDVAIIGGGYTGLSAARTLAKQGLKVAVLEAENIGWGASSRNGGMVLTGLKLSMETAMKRYGRDLAKRLFQCSFDAIDTVEKIVNDEEIKCGFTRSGHLLVANKPRHFEGLAAECEFLWNEFGYKVRLVPRKDLRSEIGSDLYFGGLVDEVSGGLNPAQYVAGLARAAEKAGALLCARARVTRLEQGTNGFVVGTARGQVLAKNVLAATSGYTGRVIPNLQRRIIPIGSFIIATERLPEALAQGLSPMNRMIFDYKHYLNYFRLWDNRLIFGGRAAFFPENETTVRQSAEILRREMVRVYPQLKEAPVDYAWGGTLDFTFDMMPHVGETNGMYYSLGYAGHGVAMATYLGQTVADAMLKGNLQEHPFSAFSFPTAPLGLYNGFPWFLPFAGAWYRTLDLFE